MPPGVRRGSPVSAIASKRPLTATTVATWTCLWAYAAGDSRIVDSGVSMGEKFVAAADRGGDFVEYHWDDPERPMIRTPR